MSIKILGGEAQALELISPTSNETRPTSIMLKRRLFDSYQNLSGSLFIDLCAGCGQIGLEALSRGAHEVFLVDKSKASFLNCKKNIAKFEKFTSLGNVIAERGDSAKWLKLFLEKTNYDLSEVIVFCDPPYHLLSVYKDVYRILMDMNFPGLLIFEGCSQKTMAIEEFDQEFPGSFKTFKQGTSFFKLYHF